jgi:hypothetical protein
VVSNPNVQMTLDEAVAEVLANLTGKDLQYVPEHERYQVITRMLNRALRAVARESEWGYYYSTENVGTAIEGQRMVRLRSAIRPRMIGDDAVRLVHPTSGMPVTWAHFIGRDALHKYAGRDLRVCWLRTDLEFSRDFNHAEDGLEIHVPVMREPTMIRLPKQSENPSDPVVEVPDEIRNQLIDFDQPDLVIAKAMYFYAQSSPLMQPRVQTLEENYKTEMYALTERDSRVTDTPFQNDWDLGISGDITDAPYRGYGPRADSRR